MRRAILVSVAIPLGLGALLMAAAGQGSPDQAPEIQAIAVHGKPVAPGVKLTVHVFPANNGRGGKPSPGGTVCTNDDRQGGSALFAKANQDGLALQLDNSSAPASVESSAPDAIESSLATWDVEITGPKYFTATRNNLAPERPGMDGTNVIGWARLVPKQVLAAAWVYTSTSENRVLQADIFYNISHTWGDLDYCNQSPAFDVENIGTHEVGHILGLAHWSDDAKMATMYPSAPSGEIKKRSLTAGDRAGVTLALR